MSEGTRNWKERSKCKDLSLEETDKLFWLGKGGSPMRARTFCMDCPVKKMCQKYAMVHDEEGIWAGTTKKERDEILAELPGLREKLKERARREGWLEDYRSLLPPDTLQRRALDWDCLEATQERYYMEGIADPSLDQLNDCDPQQGIA